MAFSFFGFKKKSIVEDIEVKDPIAVVKAGPLVEPLAPLVEVPTDPVAQPAIDPTPAAVQQALGQMDTIKATREDVIAAYKIFLGRLPESMEVVDPRVGVSPAALLVDFLASKEFLDQTPKAQLVLTVAKKIVEAHRQATSAENAAPNTEVDAKSPPAPPAA